MPHEHDRPGTVSYPLPCVGCGYDLIGLGEDGMCPECGVAIGRSISGDHLLGSALQHRRALRRGGRAAHAGAIVGWVTLAISAAAYAVSASWPVAGLLSLIPLCAAMIFTGWGWMDLTREDPEGVGGESLFGGWVLMLRVWAFVSIGVAICAAVTGAAMVLIGHGVVDSLFTLSIMIGGLFTAAALALSHVMAAQVDRCARRLLEGELAHRARGLAPTGYSALGLTAFALLLSMAPLAGWWWLMRPIAWAAAAVALLAWGVIYHTVVRALAVSLATVAEKK